MSNKAAWITEEKAYPLSVDSAPLPKAGPGEVVIKNAAVAVNPVDWKIQAHGFIIKTYPIVLGTDVAGEVYDVGPDVNKFKKGDRVIGHAISLQTNDPANGGFQLYTSCNALVVSHIPESLDYASAVVLPLGISTASLMLFKKETLALPYPSLSPKPTNKTVLVWGGASSMGATAIQLAVAAGVTVVSTASEHNIEKVKALGAKHVFDYNSPTVADDIIKAVEGTEYVGVADAIGTPEAVAGWLPVANKLGGKYGTVRPFAAGVPAELEGGSVYAVTVVDQDKDVGEAIWGKFIPEALENGSFKAKPDPIIIGQGLENVQAGMDKLKAGVSNGKVVITL